MDRVALTADLCAVAIVAAARSLGDDPLIACSAEPVVKWKRRSLGVAARALISAGGQPLGRACRVLGIKRPAPPGCGGELGVALAAAEGAVLGWLSVESAVPPPLGEVSPQATEGASSPAVEAAGGGRAEPASERTPSVRCADTSPDGEELAEQAAPPPWPGIEIVDADGCAPPVIVERVPAVQEWSPSGPEPARRVAGPRFLSGRAAQREVAALLAEGPLCGPELMEGLNLTEPCVRQALQALAEAGAVRGDALTAAGWGVQFWRLAGGEG